MKPQELRIGNLVYVPGLFGPSALVEHVEFIYAKGEVGTYSTEAHASSYKPIELTEQWLLKLGFERRSYGYFCIDFKHIDNALRLFPMTSGSRFNGMWGVALMPQLQKKIEYVHQLQNLYFALTGEELTIKE